MRLGRRITLLFLVPFICLLVLLGFRAARREIDIYESQVAADLRLAGAALRPTFIEIWRVEGGPRALEVLAKADDDIGDLMVRWSPMAAPEVERAAREASFTEGDRGDRRVVVSLPVLEEGVPSGVLELSRPLDREAQLVSWVIRDKALTSLLAVIVAVILSAVVGVVFIGRPVRALVLQARRIGDGDTSSRVVRSRDDEIGDLGEELNAMCDRLEAARTKIVTEAEQRVRAVEQLRHADRLATVGKLAAGLAHELGTPLNVVAGRAKMITSGRLTMDAAVENAGIIHGQADRMTKIIRQLLDFARGREASKTDVDARRVARTVVDLLSPIAKKRGVRLTLGEGEGSAGVSADPVQIEQVLSNLIVNAIDASASGGEVAVTVRVGPAEPPAGSGAREGSYVRVDVRDSGEGIEPEAISRVFEPFFTTKDVGLGTGLGLSVAHGIVRDHGGFIAVESEKGSGSLFSVFLPARGEA